jgi:exodeoxyribonuclease VII large subunit
MRRKAAAAGAAAAREVAALPGRAGALHRATRAAADRRSRAVATHGAALRAHDPERTLERGYALALDPAGEPLTRAGAVRAAGSFDLRMAGGTVPARVSEDTTTSGEEDT